jgi:hypothetical protein
VSQYVVTIVIAALVLVFIVYQQMRTRPIRSRQLIVIPVILALLGIVNLEKHPPDSTAAGVALAASVVTAIVFGVGRGVTVQIWRVSAVPMRKGTPATLVLWVVGLALRIVIGIVAGRSGVPTSVTTGELPLFLGITLATQNAMIWLRGEDAAAGSTS